MKAAIADLKQCNATIHSLNEAQSVSTRADFAIKAETKLNTRIYTLSMRNIE
jgi:hypothetical protein